jgi:D-3-phosphoglycerate dehydrogenase
MPPLSPAEYRRIGPYIELADKLGDFASHIAQSNPVHLRITYLGKIAENNTQLIRNAGVVGALRRSLSSERANVVNAMQLAESRGLSVGERHEAKSGHLDAIRVQVETETGVNTVDGAIVLGKPRLLAVNGITFEAPLEGTLIYMMNVDVPGVIGHVGNVLGEHKINIANFSLGREEREPTAEEPLHAIAIVETDAAVSEDLLNELKKNSAVKVALSIQLDS